MTPQPHPFIIAHKVQLTYKLFLLERCRYTLEQELSIFINEAYEEVQSFLNSSFPITVFSDLTNSLDMKCQALDKLSAFLNGLTVKPQVCVQPAVKNVERTNQLQPLGQKGTLKTDVVKFGPMLQNVLMASSVAKADQVLGATLSLQQLKHFLISQPAAVQDDDMICSITSSYDSTIQSTSVSCPFKAEEKEQVVIFEEKRQPDAVIVPPAIVQKAKIGARPPLLLPPVQAVLPDTGNPKPMKMTPLISWRREDDVAVRHQKQTSSQLLHFLRAKAKNMDAVEITVTEWSKSTCTSGSSQQTPPTIKTQSYHFKHVNDLSCTRASETSVTDIQNQSQVFRLKRAESSGSLTYTCVIATKTELWDIGDIFTEGGQGDSDNSPLEKTDCQNTKKMENSCVNIQRETKAVHPTEPVKESDSSGTKMAINIINIPEFRIRKFEETEVVVSHIVSPGNFYIQHADSITKLQALFTDSWKATNSYALQNCIPDIGTQVMGWFPKQEQWCRAQVTKICGVSRDNNPTDGTGSEPSIKVEVKRLDYGDTARLSLLNIKELTPDMAALPLQAVQVSLANVLPVNGKDWSEEAVGWFKAMVHNRTLYARLYPQGPKVTVELFLEKGKLGAMRRGAPLSMRLAQNGHAKHSKLKNIGLMNRSAVQPKTRQHDCGKYLVLCYTQRKK